MAARREIESLIFYVLGERNRQLLISGGLEAVPKDSRVAALRGLQDLGWIGHGGFADFEDSYSLTEEGRHIVASKPPLSSLEKACQNHVENLRTLDEGANGSRKEALKKLIVVGCDTGNWDTALVNCHELRKFAEKSKDHESLAFSLYHEGKIEVAQNKWDEALEFYLAAIEKYMDAGDRAGVAESNRALGVVYGSKGDHASALRCFESSLSMAKAIGNKLLEAKAEGNLAIIYDMEGRFDSSEVSHARSLELFLELGDLTSAARTSNNLGVLNMDRERFETAAEYFEKTIQTCRENSSRSVLGIALVNAGYCFARTGHTHNAIRYTDEAAAIFREPNDQNMLALSYRNYGLIEMRNSNCEKAFEWFEKGVRAAKASGVDNTFAACCYEYGMALIKTMVNPKLAKKLLKRSSSVYRELGNATRAQKIEAHLAAA